MECNEAAEFEEDFEVHEERGEDNGCTYRPGDGEKRVNQHLKISQTSIIMKGKGLTAKEVVQQRRGAFLVSSMTIELCDPACDM